MATLGIALASLGCGSGTPSTPAPPDVTGMYTVTVTNGTNTCMLPNWVAGSTMAGTPFTVTQVDTTLTGTFDGTTGMTLDAFLGSAALPGSASGDQLNFTLHGEPFVVLGACTGTLNVHVAAVLNGNTLTGEITYTLAASSDPACTSLGICMSQQSFTGTRPAP